MIDSYYTPPNLAYRLVDYAKNKKINSVVDFCVGDGELVRAALKLWPDINCYGTDVSDNALKIVKKNHPDWVLGKCDFLKEKSRNRCNVLKKNKNGFDLVLLNPPFSCIGGTIHKVTVNGKSFNVSTAMRFLSESIKYLSNNGCLLAIMPISICYSQKDKKLREYLVDKYKFSILEIPNGNFFKDCSPSIVFISINLNSNTSSLNGKQIFSLGFSNYTIFRGKISVHDAINDKDGFPFIHTTNLIDNKLAHIHSRVVSKTSVISGPTVLIPRVGKPNQRKICLVANNNQYVISDCILAVHTRNTNEAENIYFKILDNWKLFKELYKGTGAKFITIERLDDFLGISKKVVVDKFTQTISGTLSKLMGEIIMKNNEQQKRPAGNNVYIKLPK